MNYTNEKATILAVDDKPENLGIIFEYLTQQGFKVMIAENGEEAIQRAESYQPDIILLDILMPGIDGYETCIQLKEKPSTKQIPVIFMTALGETINEVKGFEAGAVDYISKPFKQEILLARINTHLELQRQKIELAQAISTKDKFFSIIAHDLKNSYAAMITALKYLSDCIHEKDYNTVNMLSAGMAQSVETTHKLMENLLTWARLQIGMLKNSPEEFDLYFTVMENFAQIKNQANQKNIQLSCEVPLNTWLHADRNMTHTIIRNLLNNAVKFTRTKGKVSVSSEKAGSFVQITVSDTGIGISPSYLKQLFRIDAKHHKTGTAGESGTGLGLILCKEFVEMNGGQIHVESEEGKGSRFIFTLPASQ